MGANKSDQLPGLAVVIPAWRGRHLGTVLSSFCAQSDQRFRVYIGDDASPDDLRMLVDEFRHDLEIVYHRFDDNLGGRDLVAQWHRCIGLTKGEEWIWLFSDDDEAEPDCVAAFFGALADGGGAVDLMRFDFKIIDSDGNLVRSPTHNPEKESAHELLHAILSGGGREWRAPEHLFRREVYERCGGFVNFPLALYSDLATWVEFAGNEGVKTLSPGGVRWRSHSEGISSGNRLKNRDALLLALSGFMGWLDGYLKSGSDLEMRALGVRFMCRELGRVQPPVPWSLGREFVDRVKVLAPHLSWISARVYFSIWFSRARHFPVLARLLHWRYLRKVK